MSFTCQLYKFTGDYLVIKYIYCILRASIKYRFCHMLFRIFAKLIFRLFRCWLRYYQTTSGRYCHSKVRSTLSALLHTPVLNNQQSFHLRIHCQSASLHAFFLTSFILAYNEYRNHHIRLSDLVGHRYILILCYDQTCQCVTVQIRDQFDFEQFFC